MGGDEQSPRSADICKGTSATLLASLASTNASPQLAYTSELTYAPVLTPIKCSIICLFLRLFGVRRWFRNLCLALIGMVLVWGLVTFFLFTFQCPTVSDAWSPTGQRPNCMAFSTLFLGTNIPNVIIDVFILSLPIYPIWSLRMPLSKKILISAVLAVGIAYVSPSLPFAIADG